MQPSFILESRSPLFICHATNLIAVAYLVQVLDRFLLICLGIPWSAVRSVAIHTNSIEFCADIGESFGVCCKGNDEENLQIVTSENVA